MPNIADVLKQEISRIARKEVRAESTVIRKIVSEQKSQISALKQEVHNLQRALKSTQKLVAKFTDDVSQTPTTPPEDGELIQRRFSSRRLSEHREKIGLSVAAYAALVGVSGPTLRAWELGKRRPSEEQMAGIVAARGYRPPEAE